MGRLILEGRLDELTNDHRQLHAADGDTGGPPPRALAD